MRFAADSLIPLKPIQIPIHRLGKNLVEYMRNLSHFEVKKFKNENELFANCIYDKFVLRSEYFFKIVKLMLLGRNCHHDWLSCDSLKDIGTVWLDLIILLSCLGVHLSLIELKSIIQVIRLLDK